MNLNNQTEYKKPLGSRLFILITVCIIVVAMAVPAFAANFVPAEVPDSMPVNLPYPAVPDEWVELLDYGLPPFVLDDPSIKYVVFFGRHASAVAIYYYGLGEQSTLEVYNQGDILYLSITNPIANNFTHDGLAWGHNGNVSIDIELGAVYSSPVDISFRGEDELFYSPPPPPDLGQEVTGVLPTVLSWIQQTLNALFVEGGALQGLLLLVAVPVAITLLLLGARFIRNLIWGA